MPKNGEHVKFKHFRRKINSAFRICADFESVLVLEDNGKQNQNESYTNKYQKHVACSCDNKLVCVYDKFSKSFKSHLGEDTVYKPFSSMIEESKYWGDVMRKNFNKELAMTKLDNEDFKNSTKCWICDNNYIDMMLKLEIIVVSLRTTEALHIETITLLLN